MGILNVTPDSFYDGGRYLDPDAAIRRGKEMAAEGADIVDVGGESTRPGADPVPEAEELARVLDVVAELSRLVPVSIDTTKARVAEACLRAGASILNDVSASLESVAAEAGAGWVAMHSRGTPKTMRELATYRDVVAEVREFLSAATSRGRAAGVRWIWVDPGIGFAKTAKQSWELMARLGELVADGVPVLVGASRKSFLGTLADWPPAPETGPAREGAMGSPAGRADASLAVAAWAVVQGASVVRVHDVAATVAAVRLFGARSPSH
jgi:dihydropteroate synthase